MYATLAFDTTQSFCTVALLLPASKGEDPVIHSIQKPASTRMAETLMPLVRDLMTTTGVMFSDIQRFGVITGPGSFTGIRVGIAAARGFGLALQSPVLGLSSLEALASNVFMYKEKMAPANTTPIFAVLTNPRGGIVTQSFTANSHALTLCPATRPKKLGASVKVLQKNFPASPFLLAGDAKARATVAKACPRAMGEDMANAPQGEHFIKLLATKKSSGKSPRPFYMAHPLMQKP